MANGMYGDLAYPGIVKDVLAKGLLVDIVPPHCFLATSAKSASALVIMRVCQVACLIQWTRTR